MNGWVIVFLKEVLLYLLMEMEDFLTKKNLNRAMDLSEVSGQVSVGTIVWDQGFPLQRSEVESLKEEIGGSMAKVVTGKFL